MRLLDAAEVNRRLPMGAAIDALQKGFGTQDPFGSPIRSTVETPSGSLLLMPSAGDAGVGVKLVTVSPNNPQVGLAFVNAVYVLFDPESQMPEAVIDGAALTALRTAAVSGVATRWLANDDAGRLVIFGAGVQATSHLHAMLAVRPVERVTVVSRSGERAAGLAIAARTLGVDAGVGTPAEVAEADLICTCTTSPSPVFDGDRLRAGVHVNAIGAYLPDNRELDTRTIRNAKLVVETREAALAEAGDVLIPIGEGAVGPDHVVADLHQLVRGTVVRTSREDVTVFKSVGLAFEDLVIARALLEAE